MSNVITANKEFTILIMININFFIKGKSKEVKNIKLNKIILLEIIKIKMNKIKTHWLAINIKKILIKILIIYLLQNASKL